MLYPSTGDFIAFVGNIASRHLVRETVTSFRSHTKFPSEGAAPLGSLPGIGESDHWAFWRVDYLALMVTDTAPFRSVPFRYPFYHTPEDTPDKIDFDRLARVVAGIERVVEHFAGVPSG